MTVLHIDASANPAGNSRKVSDYLVQQLGDQQVIYRDVANENFPLMAPEDLLSFYTRAYENDGRSETLDKHLALSEQLIAELMAAETLVVGLPMYNFGIPVYLKQWVDYVARNGVTFEYGANGPVGLTQLQDVYIATATGGTPVGSDYDFASRHLEQVMGFLGAKRIHHIDVSGSKGAPEEVFAAAKSQVDALLALPQAVAAS